MTRLFASIVLLMSCAGLMAQKIDTSPLDAYWKMTEPLKKGDSLSKATWNDFLKIEANEAYVKNQGFDTAYLENLRKNIEYVYMPKYEGLLKSRLEKIARDPATYWITYKVYKYKENEAELKKYEARILQKSYIDSIYKYAWQMLPQKFQKRDDNVTIYFLGIENDAIAGGETIIFTTWAAYNDDKLRFGVLGGHEMHHILRKTIALKDPEPMDKGLLYTLKSVLNEGTADMIDKKYNVEHEDKFIYEFKRKDFLLFQADSIVNQIDANIMQLAQSHGKDLKAEKEYRNLMRWSSGHCPGFYMADIIVRNGYKKELLKHIDDPFYFITLYNKAAAKDLQKPHVFSEIALDYINEMKKRYSKP